MMAIGAESLSCMPPGSIYRMPLDPSSDHVGHTSLLCDDALLRELRCRRWAERTTRFGHCRSSPFRAPFVVCPDLTVTAGAGAEALTARAGIMLADAPKAESGRRHAQAQWPLIAAPTACVPTVDLLNAGGPSDILAYPRPSSSEDQVLYLEYI